MAVNEVLYRELLHQGIPHGAALILADPARDVVSGGAVVDAAALTSTDVTSANGNAAGAGYVQADAATWVTLMNETKGDVNALRTDAGALRTKLNELLAALRTAGVIS